MIVKCWILMINGEVTNAKEKCSKSRIDLNTNWSRLPNLIETSQGFKKKQLGILVTITKDDYKFFLHLAINLVIEGAFTWISHIPYYVSEACNLVITSLILSYIAMHFFQITQSKKKKKYSSLTSKHLKNKYIY